jgi:hypothetical protein
LDPVKEIHDYHVIQEIKHGFLNLELSNQGKQLIGEFYTNDGEVLDHFTLYLHYMRVSFIRLAKFVNTIIVINY